jgi:hypothetical protein
VAKQGSSEVGASRQRSVASAIVRKVSEELPFGYIWLAAAGRRQAETLLEGPVFGVERPSSSARRIRGSRGGDVPIERYRGYAEAVRDLGHADAGIGQQRPVGAAPPIGPGRISVKAARFSHRFREALAVVRPAGKDPIERRVFVRSANDNLACAVVGIADRQIDIHPSPLVFEQHVTSFQQFLNQDLTSNSMPHN